MTNKSEQSYFMLVENRSEMYSILLMMWKHHTKKHVKSKTVRRREHTDLCHSFENLG